MIYKTLKYKLKKQFVNKHLKLFADRIGIRILSDLNNSDNSLLKELQIMKTVGKVDGLISDDIGLEYIKFTGNYMYEFFEEIIKKAENEDDENTLSFINKTILAAMTSSYYSLCDLIQRTSIEQLKTTINKKLNQWHNTLKF